MAELAEQYGSLFVIPDLSAAQAQETSGLRPSSGRRVACRKSQTALYLRQQMARLKTGHRQFLGCCWKIARERLGWRWALDWDSPPCLPAYSALPARPPTLRPEAKERWARTASPAFCSFGRRASCKDVVRSRHGQGVWQWLLGGLELQKAEHEPQGSEGPANTSCSWLSP